MLAVGTADHLLLFIMNKSLAIYTVDHWLVLCTNQVFRRVFLHFVRAFSILTSLPCCSLAFAIGEVCVLPSNTGTQTSLMAEVNEQHGSDDSIWRVLENSLYTVIATMLLINFRHQRSLRSSIRYWKKGNISLSDCHRRMPGSDSYLFYHPVNF